MPSSPSRHVQRSVTCFLHSGDQYLFIHRFSDRRIDGNKLNGIGGKLEPGEDYLSAAIRETAEETGYVVTEKDCQLSAVVNLTGGYEDDWVMCFFKISVPHTDIPLGTEIREGRLLWLKPEQVLNHELEVVDDLNYTFAEIVAGDKVLFLGLMLNDQEKIVKIQKKSLPAG